MFHFNRAIKHPKILYDNKTKNCLPPDTGASKNDEPFSSHIFAMFFDATISIVLQSVTLNFV